MKKGKQQGLIVQIYILALAAIIIIGVITQLTQFQIQKAETIREIGIGASEVAGEVISSLTEYPSCKWLIRYWAEHADELEIEYDAEYTRGTVTEEKSGLFFRKYPGVNLRYFSDEEAEALPEEDQRLFAEFTYSWTISRMNAIKKTFICDYLYCVMTDTDEGEHPYENQVFILSAADPGAERGTEYEQVYTLGVTVFMEEKDYTREVMKRAVELYLSPEQQTIAERTTGEKITGSGNYIDYYTCMGLSDDGGTAFLIGSTYNVKGVVRQIRISTLKDTLISMLYQFLLLNLIVGHILLYVLNPLKKVLKSIRSYTVTKDSAAVEKEMQGILSAKRSVEIRRNEIGLLTEDFVTLTKEIDEYTDEIEQAASERERMTFELETAAQIQLKMLPEEAPHFPDHPEFGLCASMTPAKMVGGDFYDYFLTDDHHLALVMADVSDKGIPAALFMAQSKALIKSQAQNGLEPAEVLIRVNNQLNEANDGKCFVTVWLAIIDLRTGEGVAANAGHEHPALCRNGESFELVIYKHNMVVGMMEGIAYRQHPFKLNPGDCLFVYTDGVPEASNESQEQFGTERMLEALNRSKDKAPGELLAAVSEEINAFMGKAARFDDTTMMCFRYHGSKEDERKETRSHG